MKKSSSSTLDGLFLDEDSPYALSGNVQELLGAARALGVPRQPLKPTCAVNPPSPYTDRSVNAFPVARRWWALPSIIPGKPIWWKCRTQNWSKTIVARATCSP